MNNQLEAFLEDLAQRLDLALLPTETRMTPIFEEECNVQFQVLGDFISPILCLVIL